ncbi:hypothetical protein TI01_0129 [Lysobacter sp. A03]|nr:hypothetical protein TI01_0129 [Lysobacter sp. A03]
MIQGRVYWAMDAGKPIVKTEARMSTGSTENLTRCAGIL